MLNMNIIYLIKPDWCLVSSPFWRGDPLGVGGGGEIVMIRNKSKPVSINFHLLIISKIFFKPSLITIYYYLNDNP